MRCYQKSTGLKFEDLYVESPEVKQALMRISESDVLTRFFEFSNSFLEEKVIHLNVFYRQRRIKRAFDLSVKRKLLPEELQNENPFEVR